MASTVKLKISIDDNGELKVVAKDADKASKATDNLGKSTDKTTGKRNKFHKGEKGVAQATSNSTKAFAKQAQTLNGGSSSLVGAYATLAANVFAVSAAFGVLQRNAGFKQLEQGIIFTGRAAGQNLTLVSKELKNITDSAISTADAMKAVSIGTSAGFDTAQMEGLTRVAKGASLALGRDMTDALDRLVRGAAKLEPEILDELGIMVRLDQTAQDFASSIGKNVSQLTQFEKRMAFTNAIIEQGEKKFGALNGVIEANPYSKLAATFDELLKGTIAFVDKGLGPIVSLIASNMGILVGVIGIFAAGVVKMMVPALAHGGKAASEMAARTRDMAKSQLSSVKVFHKSPAAYNNYIKSVANGTATAKGMTKAQNSLRSSIRMHNKHLTSQAKKYGVTTKLGKEKRATIKAEEKALADLIRVQQLEAKATMMSGRADVMHTASTGGLVATFRALQVQIAAEHATLTAETAGTNAATVAKQRFSLAVSQAGLAIRAFGTALINAIPMIGTAIFMASMAFTALKKMFGKPPTALEEQMKKTKEVLDDFPKVIDQMIDSYEMATDSAGRFEVSLKAQAGLISQVSVQMRKQLSVQRAQIIQDKARARAKVTKGELRVANLERQDKQAGPYGGPSGEVKALAADALKRARKELTEAEAAVVDYDAAQENQIQILSTAMATFESLQSVVKEGSEEHKFYSEAIKNTSDILTNLVTGNASPAQAAEQYKELNHEVQKSLNALNQSNLIVAEAEAIFAKANQPTGEFKDEIQVLEKALAALQNQEGNIEVLAKYKELFEDFGIKEGDLASLRELSHLLRTIEQRTINTPAMQAQSALSSYQAERVGRKGQALFSASQQAGFEQTTAETALDAYKKKNTDEFGRFTGDNARLKGLETTVDQTKLASLKANDALRQNSVDEATRLGGAQSGAAMQFQATGINKIKEAGKEDTEMAEKFKLMNDAVSPMMENLAQLGPEGAAMASAIDGAMKLGETFTSVFEGGSMGAKETLSAVGQMIGQINQIQQAQTRKRVAGIDKEIAAEKQRDGQSKESLAKIKALQKKKEAMEKKAFEQNKKMSMAQVAISTAVSVMGIWSGVKDPYVGPNLATAASALVIGLGAAQLAAIASTSYEGGGSSIADGGGKSDVAVGERNNTVDLAKSKSAVGELGYTRGAMGTGGASDFKPAFTGARYRAAGGSTGFVVGEQGPELFMPDTPGTIIPAGETGGEGGGTTNLNFTIQAIDSQDVEKTLSGQTGNIIRMIRETANDAGETFLEGLDERY